MNEFWIYQNCVGERGDVSFVLGDLPKAASAIAVAPAFPQKRRT